MHHDTSYIVTTEKTEARASSTVDMITDIVTKNETRQI